MKLNRSIFILVVVAIVGLAHGCVQYVPAPRGEDMTPPQVVANVKVENLPGKAQLTYQLPDDASLLYVKAEYLLNSGVTREVKASFYTNTMILDGFGDTDVHKVILYSVSKNEVASEPIIVEVQPLENPIWDVLRSLKLFEDFGGMLIRAENPEEEEVVIEVSVRDSLGNWAKLTSIESRAPVIERSHRGLDTLDYDLGVAVRDRFLNYTDTTFLTIRPIFEMELDKSKFRSLSLPGDAETVGEGWLEIPCIWDGISDITSVTRWLSKPTPDVPTPQVITFDTGVTAKLSRFVWWGYGYDGGDMIDGRRQFYIGEHMRLFEVWGTNQPNPDGSFDGWTLLGSFENVKPSGLPQGQQTVEDYEMGVNGFEYSFPADIPRVRYIRIRNIESWGATTDFGIVEIELYGDPR